jgi:hypothetical protein
MQKLAAQQGRAFFACADQGFEHAKVLSFLYNSRCDEPSKLNAVPRTFQRQDE